GRPDRWVRWGVVELTVTATLFLVALPWGPVGIALAWTASYWILTMPALWYAGQGQLGIVPLVDVVWKYVAASAAAAGLTAVLAPLFPWIAAAPAITASL